MNPKAKRQLARFRDEHQLHVRVEGRGDCQVKLRAEGRCRLCERPAAARQLTMHRLVPGREGGRYVPRNVVPLCRPCHVAVESSVAVRRMLRGLLWPVEIAHMIAWLGRPWLDAEYPRSAVLTAKVRADLVERLLDG